jgi:hypothetical protein
MLYNKGNRCLGPRHIVDGFVKELCPYEATIGLDTALLFSQTRAPTKNLAERIRVLSLASRCVSCAEQLHHTTVLKQFGLLGDKTTETPQCQHPSCFKPGWHRAKYCEDHFSTALKPQRIVPHRDAATRNLRLGETQWTCGEAFEKVLNNRDGTKVVCLDLEFSALSRKIFEIGLCEYPSGKELVNARIKHDCTDLELHKTASNFMQIHPFSQSISKRTSSNVYGKERMKCTGLIDVHSVATQFREHGITPRSIILSWHIHAMDLVLLREFFEETGYNDILPPNENCILMIPLYQKNLPKMLGQSRFPTKLEILFPLLFSGHHLVGKNHRAMVDALQLRLMVKLFEELCKPLNQRDLSVLPKKTQNWFQSAQDTGAAAEETVEKKQKRPFIQLDLDRFITRGPK